MSITVTASAGNDSVPGIHMSVYVITGGQIPGTPNVATGTSSSSASATLHIQQTGARWIAAYVLAEGTSAPSTGNSTYLTTHQLTTDTAQADSSIGWGSATQFDSSSSGAALTSGTAVTLSVSQPGGVAALEIDPSSGTTQPVYSGTAPAPLTSSGSWSASSLTSASFSAPQGSIIAVAVSAAAGTSAALAAMTVTDSLGLAWTEVAKAAGGGLGYAGIWVANAPPAVSIPAASQGIPQATAGYGFSAQLAATGGFPPFTWSVASGSLPSGLSLSASTGLISGAATTAGTSSFTPGLTDAQGNTATGSSTSITTVADPAAATSGPVVTGTWQATGVPYAYGTTTVNVKPIDHEWLIVAVSWSKGQDPAVAYVTDDSHNLYQPAGFSGSSATMAVQLFAAPNIRAASKVYVSTSAFVRNLQVTVLAVRGMPAVLSMYSAITGTGSSTGSFTTGTASPTAASLTLAVGVSLADITSLPSGWTAAHSRTAGTSATPAGASMIVGWKQAAAGSESVTFTATRPQQGSGAYAWLLAPFYSATTYQVPANPSWPQFVVQAAFSSQPGLPTSPKGWTDLTGRYLALEGPRGRNFELDELSAADLTLTLDNADGALTVGNSSSPYPDFTLVTPVRLLATWQGRTTCVFSGLVMAVDEAYEFERSVVKLTLSDDYSKLPQVLLPSAILAEQLYDDPLHLWPLNDQQGALFASNWSGRGTSTLVPVNSKYGAGSANAANTGDPVTGFANQQPASGFPTGLAGTTDTNWGNNSGTTSATSTGTCLVDRNDRTLPTHSTGGATYEVFARILKYTVNLNTGATIFSLADAHGHHVANYLKLVAVNYGTVSSPQTIFYLTHGNRTVVSAHAYNNSPANVFDGAWHHYAVTVTAGKVVSLYVDGTFIGSHSATMAAPPPNRLMFGGDATVNPSKTLTTAISKLIGAGKVTPWGLPGFFTGFLSSAAVYDRVLDQERLASHYQAGHSGFRYEKSGTRIQRVLTWAKWANGQAIETGISPQQALNYLGGGYASTLIQGAIGQAGTAGGAAGVDNGAQADITVQDIGLSECGFMSVAADGSLSFRQRDTLFSQRASWSMGDGDYALNGTANFRAGLGPWNSNVTGGAVTLGTSWAYTKGPSAVLTVSGSPSSAVALSEMIPVSGKVGASCWVMSPNGCSAGIQVSWYNSSGGFISATTAGVIPCLPGVPSMLNFPLAQPPGGAASCRFGPVITGSPANGTILNFDLPRLTPTGFQVAYLGDVKPSTDIQYLYNDVVLTRNADQATYRARDLSSRAQYYPRVYTRTVFTDPTDPQGVVDVANWLLAGFSQPQLRITQVVVDAGADPQYWPFVLGSDIGDVVSFGRKPVQGGALSGTMVIIGIEPDFGPDIGKATYTLCPNTGLAGETSPSLPGPITLDDPVNGVVSGGVLGF